MLYLSLVSWSTFAITTSYLSLLAFNDDYSKIAHLHIVVWSMLAVTTLRLSLLTFHNATMDVILSTVLAALYNVTPLRRHRFFDALLCSIFSKGHSLRLSQSDETGDDHSKSMIKFVAAKWMGK